MSDAGPRIVLLTGNSLCHNPRALKEAAALARGGYRVTVLGAWLDPSLKARDERLIENLPFKFIPVVDFTLPGRREQIDRLARRAARRAANLIYRGTGLQSPLQLGLGLRRMLRQALALDAALYVAHSEPTLYVARRLMQRGRRVAVDMEDWFSEDLLPETRQHRPLRLLRSLERCVLRNGSYASCPSQAMSAALAAEHRSAPPAVIYNAFPLTEQMRVDGRPVDRRAHDIPSLYWFSTTLGPARGLEELMAALSLVTLDLEIHLRGNPTPGIVDRITSRMPEHRRQRLHFHEVVPNHQLLSRIAEHDIGFAGELTYCRNHDLTVSNKLLHYLLGGLAVVASDTTGQREVAARAPGAIRLYPPGDTVALARTLNALLASPGELEAAKTAALLAARREFCWERQESTLLATVEGALEARVGAAGAAPSCSYLMARCERS